MTRKLLTSMSLTIALGCMTTNPVQAHPHISWQPFDFGGPNVLIGSNLIGSKWGLDQYPWLPLAIHDFICGSGN